MGGEQPQPSVSGKKHSRPSRLLHNKEVLALLRDPTDGTTILEANSTEITFKGGNRYPVVAGAPVLIDSNESLFSHAEIERYETTTQIPSYRDPKKLKNLIRQRLLPSLSDDRSLESRYQRLAASAEDGAVLVLGVGDKAELYRRLFPRSVLVLSDVHAHFEADLLFDAHHIPFADEVFSLVLIPQVLEHVARPWLVASEAQRVTSVGGRIQVEVPFAFPFHGAPYDFYRFTPSALRLLFPRCRLDYLSAPEGNWSGAATALSYAMVNSFRSRFLRSMALAISRFLVGWMKLLDRIRSARPYDMPKGLAASYIRDEELRDDRMLLEEVKDRFGT